ncbi:rho GTPase-activating protein 5-like isoform X1 [Neltuma alba]|uniref:rho GTPase-activating protein 5-like isoform X1 n=1 Tax=Neltuma alba TaxID=207710 RepID=UPI0010A4FB12|nr:rho GTPase-activating protein 5-like isoform X1 [Prosopis alba]
MTRLFRSKSWEFVRRTEFSPSPLSPSLCNFKKQEEAEDELVGDDDSRKSISKVGVADNNQSHFAMLDTVVEALKKSLVTCSVEKEDDSSMDISWPTEVRHVSHVTFDRLHGFLDLPSELEPEVPRSASAKVFGVSAESMECSYDDRGNCVPKILLSMQKQLYSEGGLKVEGIFRINAESSQEESVRDQLNKGAVPYGTDVHCLSGLIKAWFRELPTRVLDSLTPEQVVNCKAEEDCVSLVKLLSPTEAALLHWVINLMADVVEHQEFNKMNAHNIAMVFAPNMTQIMDPLTALTHAVQVVKFLKTLILKVLRERDKSNAEARRLSPCSDSPYLETDPLPSNFNSEEACEKNEDSCTKKPSLKDNFLRTSTLGRIEWRIKEKLWISEESECVIHDSTPSRREIRTSEYRYRRYDGDRWLRLRKRLHKLWRHPVFLWNKASKPAT